MAPVTPHVFAAVAWDHAGFEIAVADTDPSVPIGAEIEPFRTPLVADVHRHLEAMRIRFGDRLACVVESTNGMLDGGLMSIGLRVYRADPSLLPGRPRLGSVAAGILARAAADRPAELTRLALETGSLTGRFPEVERTVAAAAGDLALLAADGRSVAHGPRGAAADRPMVALTFDDGPHPPYTEATLAVLARYDVPATFFCVGLHAQAHRDLVRRMAAAGHLLANHTWSHPLLADLDDAEVFEQLDRTDEALDAATSNVAAPRSGPMLFRPPYGAITPAFLRLFRDAPTTRSASRSMVLWDVEPFDWAAPGTDEIARSVLAEVAPGSIVLLHDGGGDRSQTVAALPRIVEGLLDRGYAIVTVDAMLAAG